ncbi:class I SAM-dependent methyltransferase [Neobacillus ginsengisoli]|uniref:SAM-dependent MidA family methyltransferase n=1 Tax=Neobacillus ginsengisoli TaxID=904295 RepID=A0ABT9XQR9_9BACI|nr:SAM-dependent methyltransferase [Neobacillus ginsengisoli]MDQ0197309.1 SAM-dependent MidA family methyltransferase [Neobacillus ginsengisoli]
MLNYLKGLISNSPTKLLTYAEYIGAVLYHPELGYYMKNNQKIGRQGDFITTSNISDIYGRLIAKWFSRVCAKNELAPVFCEIGAGNGRFAKAFLQEWHDTINAPLQYIIVESSPFHRKLQMELLKPDFSIIQVESLEEISCFEGMVFSNELFDAFPVNVIEKENSNLFEVMVGMQNDMLFEEKIPLENPEILRFLRESKIELNEKQRIEIPLLMEKMLQDISRALTKGVVVTADYGYTNEEWMEPAKAKGSLRGYYQHRMIADVLEYPGEMDITSHIHFDYLLQKGEQVDLKGLTKLRQDEFLLKAGILQELENHYDPNPFSEVSKRNRAIRSLIVPSGISSYFRVGIQQKGLKITNYDLFEC